MKPIRQEWTALCACMPFASLPMRMCLSAIVNFGPIVWLRFMGGMTTKEIGECLDIPAAQADGEWRHAKAWLKAKLQQGRT